MEEGSGWPSDSRDCDWERNFEASGEHACQSREFVKLPRQMRRLWSHVPDKGDERLTFGEHGWW